MQAGKRRTLLRVSCNPGASWPAAEPVFVPELLGAARAPWTPHLDPRVSALAAGYQFLLDAAVELGAAATAAPSVGLVRS